MNEEKLSKNKRLKASILISLFASVTIGVIACQEGISDEILKELIITYRWIILAALGIYQAGQTFTDSKKLKKGGNE